jgi:solute carrier family 25 S-adenosylmethionine transporter 26
MLAKAGSEMAKKRSLIYAINTILEEKGVKGIVAGIVPRTLWISIGGAVFFGVYEKMKIIALSLMGGVD